MVPVVLAGPLIHTSNCLSETMPVLCLAAVCAMMSTADSSLLAFSSMWVKDLFVPYIRPRATQRQQIWFGRVMSVIGLSIGVFLGERGWQVGQGRLLVHASWHVCRQHEHDHGLAV